MEAISLDTHDWLCGYPRSAPPPPVAVISSTLPSKAPSYVVTDKPIWDRVLTHVCYLIPPPPLPPCMQGLDLSEVRGRAKRIPSAPCVCVWVCVWGVTSVPGRVMAPSPSARHFPSSTLGWTPDLGAHMVYLGEGCGSSWRGTHLLSHVSVARPHRCPAPAAAPTGWRRLRPGCLSMF